jgi:hypothetical protein
MKLHVREAAIFVLSVAAGSALSANPLLCGQLQCCLACAFDTQQLLPLQLYGPWHGPASKAATQLMGAALHGEQNASVRNQLQRPRFLLSVPRAAHVSHCCCLVITNNLLEQHMGASIAAWKCTALGFSYCCLVVRLPEPMRKRYGGSPLRAASRHQAVYTKFIRRSRTAPCTVRDGQLLDNRVPLLHPLLFQRSDVTTHDGKI